MLRLFMNASSQVNKFTYPSHSHPFSIRCALQILVKKKKFFNLLAIVINSSLVVFSDSQFIRFLT